MLPERRIGSATSWRACGKNAKVAVRAVVDPVPLRMVDVPIAAGVARHARALVQWAPTITFEQTLADTQNCNCSAPC